MVAVAAGQVAVAAIALGSQTTYQIERGKDNNDYILQMSFVLSTFFSIFVRLYVNVDK